MLGHIRLRSSIVVPKVVKSNGQSTGCKNCNATWICWVVFWFVGKHLRKPQRRLNHRVIFAGYGYLNLGKGAKWIISWLPGKLLVFGNPHNIIYIYIYIMTVYIYIYFLYVYTYDSILYGQWIFWLYLTKIVACCLHHICARASVAGTYGLASSIQRKLTIQSDGFCSGSGTQRAW